MPKLKTRRSVRRRVKISKNGKVLRWQSGRRHILSKKSAKKRRQMRGKVECPPGDARRIKEMLRA